MFIGPIRRSDHLVIKQIARSGRHCSAAVRGVAVGIVVIVRANVVIVIVVSVGVGVRARV